MVKIRDVVVRFGVWSNTCIMLITNRSLSLRKKAVAQNLSQPSLSLPELARKSGQTQTTVAAVSAQRQRHVRAHGRGYREYRTVAVDIGLAFRVVHIVRRDTSCTR